MGVLRRTGMVAGSVLATAMLLAICSSPAEASSETVTLTSKVVTSNGGGAYAKVTMHWLSSKKWGYDYLKVDDLCNSRGQGDGRTAVLKEWYRRGATVLASGETPDLGGCHSAPVIQHGGSWEGASPIDAYGIQVCAGRWEYGPYICDKIHWVTNSRR